MPNTPYATIDSLGVFIATVSKLRKEWSLPNHKELWFRGETKDYGSTSLRPELYRPHPNEPLRSISNLLRIENDLHEEFIRNATEFQTSYDDDWDWNAYFLMQHHQGPTRLLDWTDGALMAMHFALRDKQSDDEDARVFVLEPYSLSKQIDHSDEIKEAATNWRKLVKKYPNEGWDKDAWDEVFLPRFSSERKQLGLPACPCVLDFPHITRRVAAQRSRFVVLGSDPDWAAKEFKKANSSIKLILIPKEHRSPMRQELRDCGITESVIFPDLDGIGREMKQIWEDRNWHPETTKRHKRRRIRSSRR
jgi:hypothetical protein